MKVHQLLLLIALFAVFNIEAKKKKKKKAAAIASAASTTVFDSDRDMRPTAHMDHGNRSDADSYGNRGIPRDNYNHISSDSDKDTKSKLSPKDAKLADIFNKMSDPSLGKVINLDSTFGGSKCNCVCKNMDEL